MAWRRIDDNPLPWSNGELVFWRLYASLGLDELIKYGDFFLNDHYEHERVTGISELTEARNLF